MKILETKALAIPDVHVLRFARFSDNRGYFTETYRRSDFEAIPALQGQQFVQCNESHSRPGVIRGLHFQWNPFMGKLVRTIHGRMIDLALDIRVNSPTLGKAIAHDMPATVDGDHGEWIWVPPGFAHGNIFTEPTTIEYLCTGEYSPGCEAGISPLAEDIDWSLCDTETRATLDLAIGNTTIITEKDRLGYTVEEWIADTRSRIFEFGRC